MHYDFDFLVIGGGSAGYSAASTAVRLGLRTCVVEGGSEVGGLCILRGCMPSKTLIESSNRARIMRTGEEFGLRNEFLGADGRVIQNRKRLLISDFAGYRQGQLESGKFTFLRGKASFVDDHTVAVELGAGHVQGITAGAVLIATGSATNVVPVPGLREVGCWTSDDALESQEIPKSIIVLGGGAIALEFASHYEGLGVAVTVIQRSDHVLRDQDEDVSNAVRIGMERRGIQIFTGTKLERAERTLDGGKRIHFIHEGQPKSAVAGGILCALGRHPNLDGLNAEAAGVTIKDGRISTNPAQQCGVPHLFAAGDVCGPHEIVHLAVQQGEYAARNAAIVLGKAAGPLLEMDYSHKVFAAFCHPEAAMAGLTEREAKSAGFDVLAASYPFNDHGKSMVMGETDGFMKLIAEAVSRRLLGAAVVGPHASELIHTALTAIRFGATAAEFAAMPFYHPTLSEMWTYPAEELA